MRGRLLQTMRNAAKGERGYDNTLNLHIRLQGGLVLWSPLSPVAALRMVCHNRPLIIPGRRYRLPF